MRRKRLGRFLMAMVAAALAAAVVPAVAAANGAPPSVIVPPATVQYSDYVLLKAQVVPAGLAGKVIFAVNGESAGLVGRAMYNPRTGMAQQLYRAMLAPWSEYQITVMFTSADLLTRGEGSGTLTVRPEDAKFVFTSGFRPVPWLIPVMPSGRTAPFSVTARLVEVPDGTPGDLSKASCLYGEQPLPLELLTGPNSLALPGTTLMVWDHPDGLAPGVVVLTGLIYGYYTGYGDHPYAVYDPKAGMSGGAGTFVNPANGRPSGFSFVTDPRLPNPASGLFLYEEFTLTDGAVTEMTASVNLLGSFAFLGLNQVRFQTGADTVTIAAKDRRVAGSANEIGILGHFDLTRLLCGAVDLRQTTPPGVASAADQPPTPPTGSLNYTLRVDLPAGAAQPEISLTH